MAQLRDALQQAGFRKSSVPMLTYTCETCGAVWCRAAQSTGKQTVQECERCERRLAAAQRLNGGG